MFNLVVLTLTAFLLGRVSSACPTDLPLIVRPSGCSSTPSFTTSIKEDRCYQMAYDILSCDPSCCDGVDYDTCMACTGALGRTNPDRSFLLSNGTLFIWVDNTVCQGENLALDLANGCRFNELSICNVLYADFRQAQVQSECTGDGTTTTTSTTGTSGTTGASPTTSTTGSTSSNSTAGPAGPSSGSNASSAAANMAWLW